MRTSGYLRRSGTLVCALALGCSDEARDPSCSAEGHRPCDLRDQACRTELFRLVACVDGPAASAHEPDVDFVARDAHARDALSAAAAQPVPARTTELERGYALLGLLEAGDLEPVALARRRLQHLAAFYSVESGRVTVLVDDPAETLVAPALHFALAHEYVHALQDQEHGLQPFFEARQGSYDEILGARTVCEGDAQIRAALALHPGGDVLERAGAAFRELVAHAETGPLDEPAALLESSYHFPYVYGARFVYQERARAGAAAAARLFAAPPSGSADVFGALETGARGSFGDRSPPAVPRLPAEYTLLGDDMLGAIVLHDYLARRTGNLELGRAAALDWNGDRISLLRSDSGSAVLWQIDWRRPRRLCVELETVCTTWAQSAACRDDPSSSVLACSEGSSNAASLLSGAFPAP